MTHSNIQRSKATHLQRCVEGVSVEPRALPHGGAAHAALAMHEGDALGDKALRWQLETAARTQWKERLEGIIRNKQGFFSCTIGYMEFTYGIKLMLLNAFFV